LRGGTTKQEPHPTLSKGEGFKMLFFKVSLFGGRFRGGLLPRYRFL